LKCGRIVCAEEGSGPCYFCGSLVCTREELEKIKVNLVFCFAIAIAII
jgi:hypothetical protein